MRTLLVAVLLISGCSKDTPEQAPIAQRPSEQVKTITIDELSAKLGELQPVDANGDATRKKLGVIPGALLLSDAEVFSTKELPKDKAKPLVFYCANTHCSASEEAAARAVTAGYTDVRVLPDGIAGWVRAGKQVTQI